ncbi:MAG: amidohydrolase family protein [Deltaproteobacteria bacterium]|nr:amidohydrolase family protein [Deltaproteobacteria bacterium]NNL41776.1 amidohydrolase family protein [Desulfobacterales bacterium]
MVIDFHTHIFSKKIRDNREKFFFSEPAFKLLYQSPKSKLLGASEIIHSMDEQGVNKSVVFGFPWKNSDVFREENDYILDAVKRFPDRLIGLCCLDPFNKFAANEVSRCLKEGLLGIGELAFYESGINELAIDKLAPLFEICLEKDFPALIHTNEPVGHTYPGKTPNTMSQIYTLVKRFPENKIVLAHWGGGIFLYNILKKEVKQSLKNVYFDTAASPFLYDPEIYRLAIELTGQDKILFGSDFPLIKPARYFKEMKTAGLSKSEMDRICGKNAANLLNSKNPAD